MKDILNKIHHADNAKFTPSIPDGFLDVILEDPPYLYLKNQKLDSPFDELAHFTECHRMLREGGFIVLFGRGESFYRWNTILADLGFTFKEEIIWIALYKPKNFITSKSDPQGRKTVMELIPEYPFVHPIGRLDYDSEGLLLLTNDGSLTYILTHPKFEIQKKYEVTINKRLNSTQLKKLLTHIPLKDGPAVFFDIQFLLRNKKYNPKNNAEIQ